MADKRPNPTTIRLPQQTRDLLAALHTKTGIPVSQIIIRAIEAYAKELGIKL